MRSLSLACAISRATIMGPFSRIRVVTGCLDSSARMSGIGWFRSIFTTFSCLMVRISSGIRRPGLVSICSSQMPSRLILALILRSALQDTPMPTGQEAP